MRSQQKTIPPTALRLDGNLHRSVDGCESFSVLGVPIATTSPTQAVAKVSEWLQTGTGVKLVTFANVHMLTEARRSPSFLQTLRSMDMNCPDGMPLVWLGRRKTGWIRRVSGPDFMPTFCSSSASGGYRHFFYGGSEGVAEKVAVTLKKVNPDLQVAGWFSPPFAPMSKEEDAAAIQFVNKSGVDILWVCLGCPKQEKWMADHRDRLNARVVLAVGMAFDIVAGQKDRAPLRMQTMGLEWLFRLMTEPRRLLGRYLKTNTLFALALLHDVLRDRLNPHRTS